MANLNQIDLVTQCKNLTTDGTLAANSDSLVPTEKAVKTYVDAHAGTGTVTSVALTTPGEFSVTGSPVTGAGTLAISSVNQNANYVWCGPTTGSPAPPTFRALVSGDIPSLAYVPTVRTISTTAPLTGGGDLSANRTLAVSDATSSTKGVVQPDNSTITISSGVISAVGGSGTVTSVAQTVPVEFSIAGSPVTTSGTLAISKVNQSANLVWAGPTSGAAASPTFRALVAADIPAGFTPGLVLLEQHTASVSATLDFTSWYSSSYDEYLVEVLNFIPATNNVIFQLLCSTNGGSSYDTSGIYDCNSQYFYTGGVGVAGSTGNNQTALKIIDSAGNTNNGVCASIRLFSPASSVYKVFRGELSMWHQSVGFFSANISGAYKSSSAVNAFQFLFSSGNITSGIARVYGISK